VLHALPDALSCAQQTQRIRVAAAVDRQVARHSRVAEFYTSTALGLPVWWIDQDFCRDHAWLTGLYGTLAGPWAPMQVVGRKTDGARRGGPALPADAERR
jgi:hypothetical protein